MHAVFFALMLSLLGTFAALAETGPRIEAEGTQLRVTLPDGRVLRSSELVGAVLTVAVGGGAVKARLDAVEPDPDDKTGKVLLHRFSVQSQDGGWHSFCTPGPDGREEGFPLAGLSRPDGSIGAAPDSEFELVCTSGARGKCVRFGYLPWEKTADGKPMLALYNACIRMVRADYGGNDRPYTKNGMQIDIYDDLRIQEPTPGDTMPFEAGWGPDGAVCIAHPRVPENGSLDEIAGANARLAGRIGPEACTEEKARALGAVLFNRSKAP